MTGNLHVIYLAEVRIPFRNDTPFSVDSLYQTVPLDCSIVCRNVNGLRGRTLT